jgi:hypothetical protein
MNNLSLTVASLRFKVEKLVDLHRQIKLEHNELKSEKAELEKKLKEKQEIIRSLEEKQSQIKLARVLTETHENTTDIKLKINELVREIDKCIAQLNR